MASMDRARLIGSAILTPYLSLRTFRIALPGLRPLDYTNASIYTGELVDNYMEYRFILNNLRNGTFAFYERPP
jgi:hypothetical protein